MKKLQEINKLAALRTSRALSKLIDEPASVGICGARVKKIQELSFIVGSEEIVAGIYLPVTGDVKGAALLIFPEETAFTLCDLLVKREPGTTRRLSGLDKSALKEVGNILSGNYLAVLSNMLEIKIIEHMPSLSFDMFGAVVSQIIANFAQKTEKTLVVETEFILKPATLRGYFLLLFEPEEINAILGSLENHQKLIKGSG